MGETPMKGNLNDVSEVELNVMGFRGIGESIERLLRCRLDLFNNADNLVNSCFIDQTAVGTRADECLRKTEPQVEASLRSPFCTVYG